MEGLLFTTADIGTKGSDDLVDDSCTLKFVLEKSGKRLCVTLNTQKRALEFPLSADFVLNFHKDSCYLSWKHRSEDYQFYVLAAAPEDMEYIYDKFKSIVKCQFVDKSEKITQKEKSHNTETEKGVDSGEDYSPAGVENVEVSDDDEDENDEPAIFKSSLGKLENKKPDLDVYSKKVAHPQDDNEVAHKDKQQQIEVKSENVDANVDMPNIKKVAIKKDIEPESKVKTENNDALASLDETFNSLDLKDKDVFKHVKISIYDTISSKNILQTENGTVNFQSSDKYDHWLQLIDENSNILANTDCDADITASFDIQKLSFEFKYFLEVDVFIKYIVVFENSLAFTKFKALYLQYEWENSKKVPFNPAQIDDRKQVQDYYSEKSDSDKYEDDEGEYEDASANTKHTSSIIDSFYQPGSKTKSLTIGANTNRSYIVHDNNISVVKNDDYEDELQYVTTLKNLTYNDSKPLAPYKPMMYMQDQSMIFQNENDLQSLYKMDLNKGMIVEEWSMGGKDVINYTPGKKYDQLGLEQTFLGVSDNSVFKVDPRLSSKSKIVQDDTYNYKTKVNLTSLASSQDGYVALGSRNGSIRLYDTLGMRAKTLINGFGDNIKHMVVSNDGRWLLATCSDHLILYDLLISEGHNNQGVVGFCKSNADPNYYFLKLSPDLEKQLKDSAKTSEIQFSKGYFNTGKDLKESTIITSTGPYVISWKISNILKGKKEPTLLKTFKNNNVLEDNFVYGSNDKVIVALNKGVTLATPF